MDDRTILTRISELGLDLPPAPKPVASYIPVRMSGKLAFVAGQVPMLDGVVLHPGRLGDEAGQVTVDDGAAGARHAALQALAALRQELGSFEPLEGIAQVTVYVACEPGFSDHPAVANGASDLFVDVLGDAGRHARAAVGMASLPLGASVEVAVIAELA
ncbi:MAG TPA: RidA family protein [Actinomycetota bacterium]|jgi:enamine deaminase RidA (YjgF/YER057c/UK114 family)